MRFEPFRALMPPADRVGAVASLPYDVLSDDEARALAARSDESIVPVIRPEVMYSPHHAPALLTQYRAAAAKLAELKDRGALSPQTEAGYYVYRLERLGHVQTGVVGLAHVADYDGDLIRKHELTRPDKELDRVRHMDITGAQVGLVYLAHRHHAELDQLLEAITASPPDLRFEIDPVQHEVWCITDEVVIAGLRDAFAEIDALYIADGHHRAAAASRVAKLRAARTSGADPASAEFSRFVCAAFSADQLLVMPYQRVVTDLGEHTAESFLDAIAERFLVQPALSAAPADAGHFCLYLSGRWYALEPKPGEVPPGDPVARLDVAVLQRALLEPCLGIADPRRDPRIAFVGGVKPLEYLERLVDRGQYALAISMWPTRMEDVMRVADAGREMPPKSTWFEPKLASGLLVHELDGEAPGADEHGEAD